MLIKLMRENVYNVMLLVGEDEWAFGVQCDGTNLGVINTTDDI